MDRTAAEGEDAEADQADDSGGAACVAGEELDDLLTDARQVRAQLHEDLRGDAFTAQFVGMGTGPLHVPKLPGIEGIGFHYLNDADVVRHRLVREIIKAYAEDSGA